MTSYGTRENYLANYSVGSRRKRPDGVHRLGSVPGGYQAFVYVARGKAHIAIGCRRFTLHEANIHWDATARAYGDVSTDALGERTTGRYERARFIGRYILPRARRLANKLGWK